MKIRPNVIVTILILALTAIFSGSIFASPPSNDNFANAEVLSGIQVHITRSNAEATKEAGEPNHAYNVGGKSVWFKWTAPMTRVMAFTTNRSSTNIDTLLHIYKGTTLNALSNVVASNNINSPLNNKSFARFDAQEGTTYYIAIDGNNDGEGAADGTFQLDMQPSFNYQGADYDSDGMTDFAVFRPSVGTWFTFDRASGNTIYTLWGTNGDIPVVSSGSGNGDNEQNVFRPSDGVWYRQDCCSTLYTRWGMNGDIPFPESYGGDTGTHIAVFRPSNGTWYIYYGENFYRHYQFGQSGDIPVPGQYSPDTHADIAVFRPTNGVWYFLKRVNGDPEQDQFSAVKFGQMGDKPVPADYDGDGILDIAVYRPSTGVWWVLRSSDGQSTAFQWGVAEDIPTTGDYDGDGKFDYAVFRPSNGTWYVHHSEDNSVQIKQFGETGDIPVTSNLR